MYALYLNDHKSDLAGKDTLNIHCLAVAGATPGNKAFSDYYNSQLGPYTTRVWNTLDVVPHAYEADMLAMIPTLYTDSIATDTMPKTVTFNGVPINVKDALTSLTFLSKKYNYTQLYPADTINFQSQLYRDTTPINANNFFGQMLYQHIPAYASFFGISNFQNNVQRIVPNMKTPFFSEGATAVGIVKYDTTGKSFNIINP